MAVNAIGHQLLDKMCPYSNKRSLKIRFLPIQGNCSRPSYATVGKLKVSVFWNSSSGMTLQMTFKMSFGRRAGHVVIGNIRKEETAGFRIRHNISHDKTPNQQPEVLVTSV